MSESILNNILDKEKLIRNIYQDMLNKEINKDLNYQDIKNFIKYISPLSSEEDFNFYSAISFNDEETKRFYNFISSIANNKICDFKNYQRFINNYKYVSTINEENKKSMNKSYYDNTNDIINSILEEININILRLKNNKDTIENHLYIKNLLEVLDELKKTNNTNLINKLIRYKYYLMYTSKDLENSYLSDFLYFPNYDYYLKILKSDVNKYGYLCKNIYNYDDLIIIFLVKTIEHNKNKYIDDIDEFNDIIKMIQIRTYNDMLYDKDKINKIIKSRDCALYASDSKIDKNLIKKALPNR